MRLTIDSGADRTTDPDQRALLAECLAECGAEATRGGVVDIAGDRRRAAQLFNLDLDARGAQFVHLILERGKDRTGVLVWDQAHADLRERPRRDDRLLALADEASEDAVDVERRPRAGSLQG